jgi:hypothetical protein
MTLSLEMIKSELARMANGKVLILLFLAALPFMAFVFPYRNTALSILSGREKPTLDSDFHYNATYAYELFCSLEEKGRRLYAWSEITADLVFPIIYSFFLSLLIIYIFQKSSFTKPQQFLAILPFLMLLFDYGENILVAFMLFDYPERHTALAQVASVFTKLKWSLLVVSLATILFGLTYLMIQFVKRRSGKAH